MNHQFRHRDGMMIVEIESSISVNIKFSCFGSMVRLVKI